MTASSSMPLFPEQVVFGRFELIRKLGKGGMGEVWLGRDKELDVQAAIKFLLDDYARDAVAVALLKREARRGRALTHAHIVRIFDFFRDDFFSALVMEYIEGPTLDELTTQQQGGVFEVEEPLLEWLRQLCSALAYAHREELLVHRDLKPANLMIDPRGRLKVSDFGICVSLSQTRTKLGAIVNTAAGTLQYMSPQQARGEPASFTDDVYSLGATVFQLLTGTPPFYSGDIAYQVRAEAPPPIAARRSELGVPFRKAVPPEWEQVVAACLAKDAAQRPQSISEVAQVLGLGSLEAPQAPANKVSLPQASTTPRPEGVLETPSGTPLASFSETFRTTMALPGGRSWLMITSLGLAGGLLALGVIAALVTLYFSKSDDVEPMTQVVSVQARRSSETPAAGPSAPEQPLPPAGPRHVLVEREDLPLSPEPTPGHPFVLQPGNVRFEWAPPGSNQIGAPSFDDMAQANEQPITRVTFEDGYWMAATEVTQGWYAEVTGAPLTAQSEVPVAGLSFAEAVRFAEMVDAQQRARNAVPSGYRYALPSEFEWEYAAKSGYRGPFGGVRSPDSVAWGGANATTHLQPVAQLQANAWGLYDVFGNAAEWCRDGYPATLSGGDVDGDYEHPVLDGLRVVKGGSFSGDVRLLRASAKQGVAEQQRREDLGLRLALVPR